MHVKNICEDSNNIVVMKIISLIYYLCFKNNILLQITKNKFNLYTLQYNLKVNKST